jgi:hypothetical protein
MPKQKEVTSFPLNKPNSATVQTEKPRTITGPVPNTPKHDPNVHVSVPAPKDPRNYPSPG